MYLTSHNFTTRGILGVISLLFSPTHKRPCPCSLSDWHMWGAGSVGHFFLVLTNLKRKWYIKNSRRSDRNAQRKVEDEENLATCNESPILVRLCQAWFCHHHLLINLLFKYIRSSLFADAPRNQNMTDEPLRLKNC